MVRVPRGWQLHAPAGSQRAYGVGGIRRITPADPASYIRQVSVDLGNDGMAPQVTFTAAGTAQAFIGPSGSGDTWSLDQCFLSTSIGQLDPAQCILYAGPLPLANYAVTGSLAGGGSQFGLGGVTVPFGWFAWALWTGGTPGALATLRLTGTKTTLTN